MRTVCLIACPGSYNGFLACGAPNPCGCRWIPWIHDRASGLQPHGSCSGGQDMMTAEQLRTYALDAYALGADGVSAFNFHYWRPTGNTAEDICEGTPLGSGLGKPLFSVLPGLRDPVWLRTQDQHYAWSTNWASHPPGEGRLLTPNITIGRDVLGMQQFPYDHQPCTPRHRGWAIQSQFPCAALCHPRCNLYKRMPFRNWSGQHWHRNARVRSIVPNLPTVPFICTGMAVSTRASCCRAATPQSRASFHCSSQPQSTAGATAGCGFLCGSRFQNFVPGRGKPRAGQTSHFKNLN